MAATFQFPKPPRSSNGGGIFSLLNGLGQRPASSNCTTAAQQPRRSFTRPFVPSGMFAPTHTLRGECSSIPTPTGHCKPPLPTGVGSVPPLQRESTGPRVSTAPAGATRESVLNKRPANPSSSFIPPPINVSGASRSSLSSAQAQRHNTHKGLVAALHEVLKSQRNGVFPQPVNTTDVEALREAQKDRRATIDSVVKERKLRWAQGRWKSVHEEERRELERKIRPHSREFCCGSPVGVDVGGMEDIFDMELAAALQNVERQEYLSRSHVAMLESRAFDSISGAWIRDAENERQRREQFAALAQEEDKTDRRGEGNRYYENGQFLLAHRQYSLGIEADRSNPLLFANRAAASMMLMNYDAAIRDCLQAIELDQKLAKVHSRAAHAYVLIGHFSNAASHYTTAARLLAAQNHTAVAQVERELAAVGLVEKAQRLHLAEAHETVPTLLNDSNPFADDPPIRVMRWQSLIHVDPPAARSEITKYLSVIEHPAVSSSSSSNSLLMGNIVAHYCEVLVLLAKASFYCGQHYVNIALSHLKQCLALRADCGPALALQRQIMRFERHFNEANSLFQQQKFNEAHAAYSQALEVDANNRKIRSHLFNCRAETSARLGHVPAAISDSTSALESDSHNVKALHRRARCFEGLGDFARALRDMERAAQLNPSLVEELAQLRTKQQQDSESTNFFNAHARRCSGAGDAGGEYSHRRPSTGQAPQCHYSVLGLRRFSDISAVRQQYRKLTLQFHPDKVVNAPDSVKKTCETKFKELSHAYSVLGDPMSKQLYDLSLRVF